MGNRLLILFTIILCFSINIFGNTLVKELESHKNDIQMIITLINNDKNTEAIEIIDSLYQKLIKMRESAFYKLDTDWKSVDLNNDILEEEVREILKKPKGKLSQEELLMIAGISLMQLKNLNGIEYLKNLSKLSIYGGIDNIAPLSNLKHLKLLELYNCRISDLTPLMDLKKLNRLEIQSNKIVISDASTLLKLPALKYLFIPYSNILDEITLNKLIDNGVYISE